MYANYMFPFRIEKEVGMAIDGDGDDAEAFIKIYLPCCKKEMTEEKYQTMHQKLIAGLAIQFDCESKYIVPITGEDYELNTDGEDDE